MGIVAIISYIFYFSIIKNPRIKSCGKNIGLIVFAVVINIIILETVFVFVAQTHVVGNTLAHKRWMDYYWKPVNELRFRDENFTSERLRGKKKVIAIGDSFTAGHGIKNVRDRFSDQLASKLPPHYSVLNLGRDGLDTSTQLYRLFHFPIKPDVLVYQYFGNDIEGICAARGREKQRDENFARYIDYADLNNFGKWLVEKSYFSNYLYWQFYWPSSHADGPTYFDFVIPCYENKEILAGHLSMLSSLVKFSENESFPLIVVLFPFMNNIEGSQFYMEGIEDFFLKRSVPVVNVGKLSADIPLRKRVVNKIDSHASVLVHHRIADEIYKIMKEKDFIQ